MRILLLGFASIFLSMCQSQNSFEFKKIRNSFGVPEEFRLAQNVCDYWFEIDNTLPNKEGFEIFMGTNIENDSIITLMKNFDYQFVMNDTSLLIVEFSQSRKDSLIVFVIPFDFCNSRQKRRINNFATFFQGKNTIDDNLKVDIKRELNLYIKNVQNIQDDEIYIPIKAEESSRLTIIEFLKDDKGLWSTNFIQKEHDPDELYKFEKRIVDILNAKMNELDSVDYIRIPLEYYERNQLKIID